MASDLATNETSEATAAPELIRSLHLKNYRGFEDYRLNDLRRVNLLVGKNNAGKTAVLEAVHLLASEGDLRVFSQITRRRGEITYKFEEAKSARYDDGLDLSHFFHGHQITVGSSFCVAFDNGRRQLRVFATDISDPSEAHQKTLFHKDRSHLPLYLKGSIQNEGGVPEEPWKALPLLEGSVYPFEGPMRFNRPLRSEAHSTIRYVSQDLHDRTTMNQMWDMLQVQGKEDEIVEAMRILDGKVTKIVFLTESRFSRYDPRGGILLGFKGEQRRVPLGSHGEGMRRMLGLALALVSCQNGILLIDEIDTGLHYSIMGDVWRLVAKTAERLNIQVFATTHSFDCLRGLAWLCANHPDLGEEVSLQKIAPSLAQAVAFGAGEIQNIVEMGTEVR